MKHVLYLFLMVLGACSTAQEKTHFPEKALKDTLLTFDGLEKTVEEVLSQYKGKIVVLDIWASWCLLPFSAKKPPRAKVPRPSLTNPHG